MNKIISKAFHKKLSSSLLTSSFQFCTNHNNYKTLLSQHIVKIIQSKPQQFRQCSLKFNQVTLNESSNSDQTKSKLNLIFRIYSLPNVLSKYKEEISCYVIGGQIKRQQELDRLSSLLLKNVKLNKSIKISELIQLKDQQSVEQQQNIEKEQFEKMLEQLKNKQTHIDVTTISKHCRQKFKNIDSKFIYQKLKDVKDCLTKILCQNSILKQNSKETNLKQFWDKMTNIKPRLLPDECNDPEMTKAHLQRTEGRHRFRFPPEPNGYLHIGHIKSIRINFETAKRVGGLCFLRYDDTNPETQSHEYIQNILKNIRWLGYEPDRITYASDYFDQMLLFAKKLIAEGHAYVCDSSQSEIQRERKQKLGNKYRERSIEQSLSMFPNLIEGQTLRLKLDPTAKNPTLRDPVIYRIKNQAHPRTGNKYKVYPIYDFAHCICDSLEDIDISLCSLEFQVRRELYYKILDLLKLYKPSVWQYSRLNVQGSVISKRKIKALIENERAVDNWSDPRLMTIGGLMNRGYTPSMLLSFIDKINASRAGNENIVQISLLEREMRKQLFKIAQKSMMVLNPRTVEIQDIKQGNTEKITIELSSDIENKQSKQIQIGRKIFIEQSQDICQEQPIILKYLGAFKVKKCNNEGVSIERMKESVKDLKNSNKQLKVLHWVPQQHVQQLQVILYDRLLDKNLAIRKESKKVFEKALIPKQVLKFKGDTQKYWQMQRLGYFKFDNNGNFIRCIGLNEKEK